MNPVDRAILLFLNSFARRSWVLDNVVSLFGSNMLLKGAIFVFLFWFLWFRPKSGQAKDREFLLLGTVAPMLAVVVARIIASSVPFRERPLREATLHFVVPYGLDPETLQGWSSFPSDHAAFFFALSVILFFVSRRVGLFSIVYSGAVICFPRLYLGIHYPSDLAVGALIGLGVGSLALIERLRQWVTRPVLRYLEINPPLFYGCLSAMVYLIGTVCEPVPELIRAVYKGTSLLLARFGILLNRPGKQSIVEPALTLIAVAAMIAIVALLHRKSTGQRNRATGNGD